MDRTASQMNTWPNRQQVTGWENQLTAPPKTRPLSTLVSRSSCHSYPPLPPPHIHNARRDATLGALLARPRARCDRRLPSAAGRLGASRRRMGPYHPSEEYQGYHEHGLVAAADPQGPTAPEQAGASRPTPPAHPSHTAHGRALSVRASPPPLRRAFSRRPRHLRRAVGRRAPLPYVVPHAASATLAFPSPVTRTSSPPLRRTPRPPPPGPRSLSWLIQMLRVAFRAPIAPIP